MVFPFHKLKLLAIQREREKEKREGGGVFGHLREYSLR